MPEEVGDGETYHDILILVRLVGSHMASETIRPLQRIARPIAFVTLDRLTGEGDIEKVVIELGRADVSDCSLNAARFVGQQ